MVRTVLIVVAVAALVAAGVLAGIRTNRFGVREDLRTAGERLKAVPRTVGPWVAVRDFEMDPKIQQRAEAVEYVSRVYRHRDTEAQLSVLMLCGEPGPIASHTPDTCYGGLGYETNVPTAVRTVPMPGHKPAEYFSALFRKPNGDPFQVCWAWGADGDWYAAEASRGEFALRSVLYKLYVSRELPAREPQTAAQQDPIHEFLTVFLPEIRTALAPPDGQ
jgi:hypothetical protein